MTKAGDSLPPFLDWAATHKEVAPALLACMFPVTAAQMLRCQKKCRWEGNCVVGGHKMSNQQAYLNCPEHLRALSVFYRDVCVHARGCASWNSWEEESWILMAFSEWGGLWLDSQRRALNGSPSLPHMHTHCTWPPPAAGDKAVIIKHNSLSLTL